MPRYRAQTVVTILLVLVVLVCAYVPIAGLLAAHAPATSKFTAASTTVPAPPTDLVAQNVNTTDVFFTWTQGDGTQPLYDTQYAFTGYGCVSNNSWSSVQWGPPLVTSGDWDGFSVNTTYSSSMTLTNASGQSAPSNCVDFYTTTNNTTSTPTVPSAPTNLTPNEVNSTDIFWTWTAPTGGGLINYELVLYGGTECWGSPLAWSGAAATSVDTGGLTSGDTYSAYVREANNTGWSPFSSCVTVPTLSAPPAPTLLTVVYANESDVFMTWTQAAGGGIESNAIYAYTGLDCNIANELGNHSTSGPTTHYDWTASINPTTVYSFVITATNSTGTSDGSNCANTTTAGPPGPPTGLALLDANATDVSLVFTQWGSSPSGVEGGTLYTFFDYGCMFTAVQSNSTSYPSKVVDSGGLINSTEYSFEMDEHNGFGYSANSTCVNATTAAPAPPSTPTSLTATTITDVAITLTWTNPTAGTFTNITILYGTVNLTLSSNLSAGEVNNTTIGGLTANTAYYFAIEAWNGSTASAVSLHVSATTGGGGGGVAAAVSSLWLDAVVAVVVAAIVLIVIYAVYSGIGGARAYHRYSKR